MDSQPCIQNFIVGGCSGASEARVLGCWIWLLNLGPYHLPCRADVLWPHNSPQPMRSPASFSSLILPFLPPGGTPPPLPAPATLKALCNELIWGSRTLSPKAPSSTHHEVITWAEQCPPQSMSTQNLRKTTLLGYFSHVSAKDLGSILNMTTAVLIGEWGGDLRHKTETWRTEP